ncbi:MAG: ADP-ribosylglycohydrolase family protein [Sandaracinus sp.]|nr:ADP-ribosylglycohydrolase family protein [Sandaracinus sp.]
MHPTREPPPVPNRQSTSSSRLAGALFGVALGDALGLPFEGLGVDAVRSRFERADRFRLFGRTGFVSDDTEQSTLLLESLRRGGDDDDACVRAFRRAMVGWFWRLPFGIGGATLRACLRLSFGVRPSGVRSAGNGAAMRAGVLGVVLADDPGRRRRLGKRLAEVTHRDERAVQGALYVAELAALASRGAADTHDARWELVRRARNVLAEPSLVAAVESARELVAREASVSDASRALGHTGFVVHSLGLCTFVFLRFGGEPMRALEACIEAGGDTDTHGAIVGCWVGASHGDVWPRALVSRLHDGPFGPTHLRALVHATAADEVLPHWSRIAAFARNLALYPVVLAHGFSRLLLSRAPGPRNRGR